jgi:hypothetical protein
MKTITIPGPPHFLSAIMVTKAKIFHDHETLRIDSSGGGQTVEKTIFRIVVPAKINGNCNLSNWLLASAHYTFLRYILSTKDIFLVL